MKHTHGPRLSKQEYERAIVALHEEAAASGSGHDAVRRRELELTIDHRLGTLFPSDRRDELWQAQQRIEKARLRLAASWLATFLKPPRLHARANRVAQLVIDEYAKVLAPDELHAYFGPRVVARPELPLDED